MLRLPLSRLGRNRSSDLNSRLPRAGNLSPFTASRAFNSLGGFNRPTSFARSDTSSRQLPIRNFSLDSIKHARVWLKSREEGDKVVLSVSSMQLNGVANKNTTVKVGALIKWHRAPEYGPILRVCPSPGLPFLHSSSVEVPQMKNWSPTKFSVEKYLVAPGQELKVGTDVATLSSDKTESIESIIASKSARQELPWDHLNPADRHVLLGATLGFLFGLLAGRNGSMMDTFALVVFYTVLGIAVALFGGIVIVICLVLTASSQLNTMSLRQMFP